MPYNGSGTFNLYTPGTPFITGTTISSSVMNAVQSDIATGLSTAVTKDGQTTITANIPMATHKLTGLAAGSALTDSATLQQVQYGFGSFLTSVAGTNTVTGTATPTPAYTVGQRFTFVPAVTNTGAVTLNISSVGAGAVQLDGAALIGGELEAGTPVTVYVTAATPVFEIVTAGLPRGTSASTFTFNGSGGTSGSVTMTYQKIGNWVTLHFPTGLSATTGTGSDALTSNTALPAAIRPVATQLGSINAILDNNAAEGSAGSVAIDSSGILVIRRTVAGLAWTNSSTCGLVNAISVTYFVG